MKELLKSILGKIKDSGIAKIDTSYLKDNSWFYITEEVFQKKIVYIFRTNGQLLISENGDVTKAKWENLIHSTNSMLLDINDTTTLYNIIYLTPEYLVLQKDGKEETMVFIKQQRYEAKMPKGMDENPIEFIFRDLSIMLNENNSTQSYESSSEKPKKELLIIDNKNGGNIELISENREERKKQLKKINLEVRNGKYGFIDSQRRIKVPFKYEWAEEFSSDLALVKENGRFGYINDEGEVKIDLIYDGATSFKNGRASVNLNGNRFYINLEGDKVE